jgi:hypothetical protein
MPSTSSSISGHNVVIACLPDGETGNNPVATVATRMTMNFPSLKFGLIVGIGGGVPSPPDYNDIRLGVVAVSSATGEFGGVVQYDRGKTHFRVLLYVESATTRTLTRTRIGKHSHTLRDFWARLSQLY